MTFSGLTGPLQHAQDAALLGPEEEHQKIDALEAPVEHAFTPGRYVRTVLLSDEEEEARQNGATIGELVEAIEFRVRKEDAGVSDLATKDHHQMLDRLESFALAGGLPLVDQPLVHRWLPGLYVRQITNPAGSLVTTEVHKTRHPFFVLSGVATIKTPEGVHEIAAPYHGVTVPGTRRLIFAGRLNEYGEPVELADVVWITVHAITPEEEAEPDEDKRLAMIRDRLVERREDESGKTAHEIFREKLRPVIPGLSEDEVFARLSEAAEEAHRAAGSPPELPVNYAAGRDMARRLAEGGRQ